MNPLMPWTRKRGGDPCEGCHSHSYDRTGKLRHHRTPPNAPRPQAAPDVQADPMPDLTVLPLDPLAFDADPDAFLRAVVGRTYGEAR